MNRLYYNFWKPLLIDLYKIGKLVLFIAAAYVSAYLILNVFLGE